MARLTLLILIKVVIVKLRDFMIVLDRFFRLLVIGLTAASSMISPANAVEVIWNSQTYDIPWFYILLIFSLLVVFASYKDMKSVYVKTLEKNGNRRSAYIISILFIFIPLTFFLGSVALARNIFGVGGGTLLVLIVVFSCVSLVLQQLVKIKGCGLDDK